MDYFVFVTDASAPPSLMRVNQDPRPAGECLGGLSTETDAEALTRAAAMQRAYYAARKRGKRSAAAAVAVAAQNITSPAEERWGWSTYAADVFRLPNDVEIVGQWRGLWRADGTVQVRLPGAGREAAQRFMDENPTAEYLGRERVEHADDPPLWTTEEVVQAVVWERVNGLGSAAEVRWNESDSRRSFRFVIACDHASDYARDQIPPRDIPHAVREARELAAANWPPFQRNSFRCWP